MAANMSEDLGLETKLADSFTVEAGLLGGSRGSQLNVIDTESIESLGDCNLGLGIKECVGELLSLYMIE
jgi:hypothetical protein